MAEPVKKYVQVLSGKKGGLSLNGSSASLNGSCGSLSSSRRRSSKRVLAQISEGKLPELIEEIGMGKFQMIQFALLATVPLSQGSGMMTVTNITTSMKGTYGFSDLQSTLLDSLSYGGFALGSYFSGFLADLHGRRLTVVLSSLGITLAAILMSRASGYYSLVVTRILHGTFCGLGGPASLAMLSEIIPGEWRSVMFIMFMSFQALGELYACCGLMMYMPDLKNDCCWNKCILWSALPAGLMLLTSIAKLQQSVCYLVARGEIDEARIVLKQIATVNKNIEVMRLLKGRKYVPYEPMSPAASGRRYARSTNRFQQFDTAGSIMTVLCQGSTLKKVILFSILAGVGNIGTAGMSEIWPEILRRMSNQAHVGNAAEGLALLALVGVPCGVFSAVLTFFRFSSHRLLITFSGLLGAAGMVGLAFIERPAGPVGISMLMANIGGRLQESITLAFCSESFDTRIRSSATGVVIFWGTMLSVASPMLTAVMGEKAYISMAAAAFLMGSFSSLPLKETKMERLDAETSSRWAGSNSSVEQVPESEADSSTSSEEEDPEKLSWLFENGTLGATMELSLLMGIMGLAPGVSLNCFYTSMGYSIDFFQDRSVFTKMLLAGTCMQIPLTLIMPCLSSLLDQRCMIQRSVFLRLGCGIFALSILNVLNVFQRSQAGLLALGFAIGILSICVLETSISIADNLPNGGLRPFVQLGFVTGGVVPLLLEPFIGYGPGSASFVKVQFFVVPCALCLLVGAVFCQYHLQVIFYLRPNQASKRGNIADLAGAYMKLQLQCFTGINDRESTSEELTLTEDVAHHPSLANDSTEQRCSLETVKALLASSIVFLQQASCYFFAGLFPMVNTPEQALKLYFYLISGDMLGNLITFTYDSTVGFRQSSSFRWATQYLLLCLAGLAAVAMATLPSISILQTFQEVKIHFHARRAIIPMAFNTFLLGGIAQGGLGSCFPRVQTAKKFGALTGLIAVLCCYMTILRHYNVPPPSEGLKDDMFFFFPFEDQTEWHDSSYPFPPRLYPKTAASLLRRNTASDTRSYVISPDGRISTP
eukprot:CAMPEP_0197621560 /NCGR_PEP_ID=MMETSP1338-20131121/2119_1 /TAXON_ID=43686 ORGANISM="Pelagodinium beii, Strain RCC1491" /NCGR_SAMPLE_ID=MMETSP1338 /ASSEMBLY_ACC=CAM_ASM_000754 /LENGTH=1048 /DNA_ID=CAMNT_0043191069 /DNA_START=124 /DNA_END=3270 /DNA_ORIENTATION=-